MARTLALVSLFALACSSGAAPDPHPTMESTLQPSDADLDWKLSASAGQLELSFTYTNNHEMVVYVADRLVSTRTGKAVVHPRPVVDAGGPNTARATLARISGQGPSATLSPALFVAVAPGSAHTVKLTLPLPLQSWHPDTSMAPLEDVSVLGFRVATIVGEPPSWTQLTLADGSQAKVPEGYTTTFVDGGTQRLP